MLEVYQFSKGFLTRLFLKISRYHLSPSDKKKLSSCILQVNSLKDIIILNKQSRRAQKLKASQPLKSEQKQINTGCSYDKKLQMNSYIQIYKKIQKQIRQQFLKSPEIGVQIKVLDKKQLSDIQIKIKTGYNADVNAYLICYQKQDICQLHTYQQLKIQNKVHNQINIGLSAQIIAEQIKNMGQPSQKLQLVNQPNMMKQRVICNKFEQILVRKGPLQFDTVPFQTQRQIVYYIRGSRCPYIATYYFAKLYQSHHEIDQLYLQYYNLYFTDCIPTPMKSSTVQKLAKGIAFLGTINICHRDLKFENIMLNDGYSPKIIDFGSSAPFHHKYLSPQTSNKDYELRTTRYYNIGYHNLPQCLQKTISRTQFDRHQLYDMYAFGRIIKKLFCNQVTKFELGEFISQCYQYLAQECSSINPDQRMTVLEASVFINKIVEVSKKIQEIQLA